MDSMQLDELRTFVTLAEVKNFTKTAERLLMSQPSVSLHIKNLEKEFQTELFIRSPKILKITPSGELFLERAKHIISIYEATKQDILELHESVRGPLKIGASFTIGEYLLPSILVDLQKRYSELEIEITIGNTEEIAGLVQQVQVDIGLIEGEVHHKDVTVVPFMEDELFIVASSTHPLANKEELDISDLQHQSWITREKGSGTRDYLWHLLSSNGLKKESMITISSNQGIKESVKNGLGITLLSQYVIDKEIENGSLQKLKLSNHLFKRKLFYLYLPLMQEKRNVKAFVEALETNMK